MAVSAVNIFIIFYEERLVVNIMFEQDYVMRMIKSLVKFLAKTLLKKDSTTYELSDEERYTKTDYLHKQIVRMIEQGKINEAENLLYEKIDSKNEKYIELALDFYERLNNLDDEFLEKSNFPRAEIELGLKDIAKEFGISI